MKSRKQVLCTITCYETMGFKKVIIHKPAFRKARIFLKQQLVGWFAARERARLYEAERQWSQQLAAIGDASRQIAASLDLDRTLRLVMAKAAETLPMDAGALFQFDQVSQLYRMPASHNLTADHAAGITFAPDEGVPGWVVRHQRPLIIPNAAKDKRVHPYILEEGIRCVLAIPLVARKQVVGVLASYCKSDANVFNDEALRLAQVFADQAAVFIENARLVDELRRAAAELEARVEKRTRQLRHTQAQVIRAEKMAVVGRLATSVAHEVNNPLQAIALHLQLFADESLSEAGHEQLHIVQQELARIARIVQRLLDFQRPQSGEHSIQHISDLLDDVVKLTRKQLQRANVTLIREEDTDLAPVQALGDQLKQVFLNLILNAIEAMPEGGELRIRTTQTGRMIQVSFKDTGVGMSTNVVEQLFEPFFSTKHHGTGLGLAVSHDIVARHSGTIDVRSRLGEGAKFTVNLPVYDIDSNHTGIAHEQKAPQ